MSLRRLRFCGPLRSRLSSTTSELRDGSRCQTFASPPTPPTSTSTRCTTFISRSYWAEGIPRQTLARAIAHSIPFSAIVDGRQVGFARLVTDHATFAYLADVYVLEEFRGRGYGHRIMEAVMAHPEVQGIRRFLLVTRDAHSLYRAHGFVDLAKPDRHMEVTRPGIYEREGRAAPPDRNGGLEA